MDERSNIQQTIRQLIREISKKDTEIPSNESLFDLGVLDSFSLVELVAALEKAFQIKIPDTALNPRQFETVDKIESYVKGRE